MFEDIDKKLSRMVSIPTVSGKGNEENSHIEEYRNYLKEAFPHLLEGADEIIEVGEARLLHLKGSGYGKEPPVLFTGHMDVVPISSPEAWKQPPFSGKIVDGDIWGRGAQDMKGPQCALLSAFDQRLSEGWRPERDIWIYLSCDEEIGGPTTQKAADLLEEKGLHFETIFDEGGTINEDFMGIVEGTAAVIGIEEKGSFTVQFIARSSGGHSANPPKHSSIARLAGLVDDIENHDIFPRKKIHGVSVMLEGMAKYAKGQKKEDLLKAAKLDDEEFLRETFLEVWSLTRTTIAFTIIHGGTASNAMPKEVTLTANLRVPSGQDPDEILKILQDAAKEHDVDFVVKGGRSASRESSIEGKGYRTFEKSVEAVYPGLPVIPFVLAGGTDSRYFEKIGDQTVRFSPMYARPEQGSGVHGDNESAEVTALRKAAECYYDLLGRLD